MLCVSTTSSSSVRRVASVAEKATARESEILDSIRRRRATHRDLNGDALRARKEAERLQREADRLTQTAEAQRLQDEELNKRGQALLEAIRSKTAPPAPKAARAGVPRAGAERLEQLNKMMEQMQKMMDLVREDQQKEIKESQDEEEARTQQEDETARKQAASDAARKRRQTDSQRREAERADAERRRQVDEENRRRTEEEEAQKQFIAEQLKLLDEAKARLALRRGAGPSGQSSGNHSAVPIGEQSQSA